MSSKQQNQETGQSLSELVTALAEEDRANYRGIIRSMKIPISAFEPFCSWSKDAYTRNCIVENEEFELILLCWEAGQKTPIHDHGGEECWVRIIQGEFGETIYKADKGGQLNVIKSSVSKTGDISYMVDFMGYHHLENQSESRGMSLHLYAKPIRSCNMFDKDSGESVHKELEYNTVSEMMIDQK